METFHILEKTPGGFLQDRGPARLARKRRGDLGELFLDLTDPSGERFHHPQPRLVLLDELLERMRDDRNLTLKSTYAAAERSPAAPGSSSWSRRAVSGDARQRSRTEPSRRGA